MKVAILGSEGQLAHDLLQAGEDWEVLPLRHSDLDICDHERVLERLADFNPDAVINTAAFHRVDDCEEQIEKAFRVNTWAVRNLAQVCSQLDSVLMHVSTDYVFDGRMRKPYVETDQPGPVNAYGVSKLAGEYFVRSLCTKYFITRSSGLYGIAGSRGKGGNFVQTMMKMAHDARSIRVVSDQILSPTHTLDLATTMGALLETEAYGLYHIANGGECSWYEFAATIFELAGIKPDLQPIATEAYGEMAKRPSYSALDHSLLHRQLGENLPHWREALTSYMQREF